MKRTGSKTKAASVAEAAHLVNSSDALMYWSAYWSNHLLICSWRIEAIF